MRNNHNLNTFLHLEYYNDNNDNNRYNRKWYP